MSFAELKCNWNIVGHCNPSNKVCMFLSSAEEYVLASNALEVKELKRKDISVFRPTLNKMLDGKRITHQRLVEAINCGIFIIFGRRCLNVIN